MNITTGTRVKVTTEKASSIRYFVLDVDGDNVRLVPTYGNAAMFVGEEGVSTRPIGDIEVVEQFKSGLHAAWIAYAGTTERVALTEGAIKAGKAQERRDRARQFRF